MSYYSKFPSLLVYGSLHPYTQTYLAAMTTQPSAQITKAIDNFVRGIVDDGLWSKFDALYIFKMHDAQAARINLAQPGTHDLSTSGSPVFTAGAGYAGAVSGYLQTSANISTFSNFSQDNAHIGGYIESAQNSNTPAIGSELQNIEIRPVTAGTTYFAINTTGNAISRSAGGGTGHSVASRLNSSQVFFVRDGAMVGSVVSNASVAVAANPFKVCGGIFNNNTSQFSFAHVGSGLTEAESDDLYQRILTYRTEY